MPDISKDYTAINPADVPGKVLRSGDKIPTVGLGTFGSDRFTNDEIADAVKNAIRLGYRHIDCAAVYGNEKEIGQAIQDVIAEGVVTREELFITGKVWNDRHRETVKACQETLDDLQLDYIDLYLIHWPYPNYHAPGCDGDSRNPDSKPFSVEEFMDTWAQMESLVESGKARNIGTSNMTIAKFDAVWDKMNILPAVNEMEMHPCFQQQALFDYCMKNGIQPIGFMPIGSPTRPDRDQAEGDAVDIETPEIQAIAKARGVHPAVICIKWAIKNGQVTIPFSVFPMEYLSNLESSFKDPLTDEEFASIKSCECNSRLVKGQVFLWEGAEHWEDLWDADGTIAQ